MNPSSRCPECGELVEGVWWSGGCMIVFEHKGIINDKQHHYKLSVEKEPVKGLFDRKNHNG